MVYFFIFFIGFILDLFFANHLGKTSLILLMFFLMLKAGTKYVTIFLKEKKVRKMMLI